MKRLYLSVSGWVNVVLVLDFLLAVVVGCLLLVLSFLAAHVNDKVSFGVSFSPKYAAELGINWQASYLAILDDLGVKHLRLMSYWDLYEPKSGQFDFENLDWQMQQAATHSAKVSLAIGLRQPRWPECHQPAWASQLDDNQQYQALLDYLKAVTLRYRNNPALESWQLENEASNHLFGVCPAYNREHLAEELKLVRALDPNRPVITNVGNEIGFPVEGTVGDKIGFSVYRRLHVKIGPISTYLHYWYMPAIWHSLRAEMVTLLHHTPVFIHELQAEPWGPVPNQSLSIAEQNKTMNSELLLSNTRYALKTGMKSIYLWGAEWWYWRLAEAGDPSIWQSAKAIFASQKP